MQYSPSGLTKISAGLQRELLSPAAAPAHVLYGYGLSQNANAPAELLKRKDNSTRASETRAHLEGVCDRRQGRLMGEKKRSRIGSWSASKMCGR
eukprot:scaffold255132_cov21-Tisochrysis_lutea.AAC.1